MKKVLGTMLCVVVLFSCFNFSSAETSAPSPDENVSKEFLQYFVKWDAELEPEEALITEAQYQATLDMDKNENGIWDVLEEEEEEEDTVWAAAAETGILGDLNGDMIVDNRDVVLMYRHVAGWDQDINSRVLDFNGDGYVNIGDANHLLKYVAGWPDTILYKGMKYDIIYHLYTESMYQDAQIYNANQDYYYSSDGLSLKNITADGYIFEGWYDGEGSSAERVRKIDAGETGEIELYARWTPRNYKIDFDSEFVAVESKYYTIETGAILSNPSLSNYIFVGWSNQDDGRLVKAVPKGTFGNLTLVANWASRRNLAKPVRNLGDPIIAEDTEEGKIIFIYHIGEIENIPLFTLYRFSTAEGITSSVTLTKQTSISSSDAKTISETVANATTDSASWTLSEGWNESTNVTEESAKQAGMTREEAETSAKSSTNTYRLDTSRGSSDVVTDSSQYAYNIGTSLGGSHSTTDEDGWKNEFSVDAQYERERSAGVSLGDISVGGKSKFSIGAHAGGEDTHNHSETSTSNWGLTFGGSGGSANTTTSTKTWNSTSSFSNSSTMSTSRTTSEQISELITNRYGYGQSYSKNGTQSSGQGFVTENSQQHAYSNTVTYNTSELCSEVTTYTVDGKMDGYYRQVLAGTAHVFAVVGYDVATSSYFTYTYTVMDDETYPFLDYSKTTPSFDDNEIGVIPFEIPYFVNDYVNARIIRSTGLEVDISTGTVTGYSGNDPIVVIPSYVDVNNGDGTYTSIPITGINSNAFRNNTQIQGIKFSEFITEIPDSAFEGCTNLTDLYIPDLTKVGNRAFYGCTSLNTLTLSPDVVTLGNDAFTNVNSVEITAANKAVALAAVSSGAKNVVLNVSNINEELRDVALDVPSTMSSFELRGERKQYQNLRIKSSASTTKINGVSFTDCTQIPLELHSSTVELNQTSVSSSGYCMILAENACNLNLFGTNQMSSSAGGAIVCGTTTLANINSSVQASLQVSGNIYVYGSLKNQDKYLNQTSGSIISITQEQFNQYVSGVYKLVYDANGGSVSETDKTGYSGVAVGTLPTPTRTGYTFAGWYTAASGGTQVTSSSTFISSSSVKIYAHWTANSYTVTFNVNGGSSVSPASKSVTYDSTYGTLASASRDYYRFDGWYTAATGGTQITTSTKVTITSAQTLYAHWTIKPESGWVTEDKVPTGATITQTSWSYRESTEDTASSKSGWTSNGNYWNKTGSGSKQYASFPSTYNTSHWTYTELNGSAYAASETTSNKREVTNTHAGYVYWHWAYNAAYYNNTSRWISDRNQWAGSNRNLTDFEYKYFYAFKSTVNAPTLDSSSFVWGANAKAQNIQSYNCASCLPSGADTGSTSGLNNPRFLRLDYYTSTYTDYQKVYKYYRDVSNSATDPGTGSNISNKVKYVKYREK